ncbi:MAG TPA: proton-conducting transporter membrane subunit [Candidatus Cloacimonadota bacterium]|nr:proton-conducting transporter membrane subunit [Candidatus Cloacimonadota bacterium]
MSALLSGALLNTALIPILRMDKLMKAAGLVNTAQSVYLIFGFTSLFIAAVFILKTKNYKRILAYSSIENMGFVMLAFGAGGMAVFAGYLHILGHSLIKAALFLVAGNIVRIYDSKLVADVRGLLNTHKASAWLWLIGFAMITGFPPSPLFVSKFFIVTALLSKGLYPGVMVLLFISATIVWAMAKSGLYMTMGESAKEAKLGHMCYLVPAGLLLIAAIMGVWLPVFD